jgi:hypothetical protein
MEENFVYIALDFGSPVPRAAAEPPVEDRADAPVFQQVR